MILPIKVSPQDDRILREASWATTATKYTSKQIKELCKDLIDTVQHHNGYGLSAPQVGHNIQIFVMNSKFLINNYTIKPIVVINPVIYPDYTSETDTMLEECFSLPGKKFWVRRYKTLKATYEDPNGDRKTGIFRGISARVFQHEHDHLQGILIDEASRIDEALDAR